MVDYRMQNPMDAFFQTAGGLQQLQQNRMAMQQQQQQYEAQQAAMQQYKQLQSEAQQLMQSGATPQQVAEFSIRSPELGKIVRDNLGLVSQDKEARFMQTTQAILADPSRTEELLKNGYDMVPNSGDEDLAQVAIAKYRENPSEFIKGIEKTYAMLNPKGFEAYQNASGAMTQFQAEDLAIKRENTKLRAMEAEARRAQQSLDSESNAIKRQQLQAALDEKLLKVEEQRGKIEQTKKSAEMGKANALEAATIAEELLQDPRLDSIVGTVQARVPTVSGESQDLINKANRLQSLLTVDNLKLMTGVLTDRDIQFLTNVASGLNITDNGILGSEKGVRDRLEQIAKKIRQGVGSGQQSQPASQGLAPQGAIDYLKANPQLKEQFRAKYGYIPEGV